MIRAFILNIGDEVLSGRTINTNSAFLGYELEKIGITVEKCVVVGDEIKKIGDALREFLNSAIEILITTGGLGPTGDDITKQAIALAVNRELVLNEKVKDRLVIYYGNKISDSLLKQAYFPEGSQIIKNNTGSADGFIVFHKEKKIIALVGPPPEAEPMFKKILPYLYPAVSAEHIVREFTVTGGSEADFEKILAPLNADFPQVVINSYCAIGKIRYLIKSKRSEEKDFNRCVKRFKDIFKDYIVGEGHVLIEDAVVTALKNKNYTISFAESCTGGLLAAKLISIPGASAVISESLIVYSNDAKSKYLHVKSDTLATYGAVSPEAVREMATGLACLTGSDVTVAVSGIAGPDGGTRQKPVGLVCYAIKIDKEIYCEKRIFKGDRNLVRERAALWIFYRLWYYLKH